jgi:hypothetical protein
VIKVIIGTLIILGDHLDRFSKSMRGQIFSLILGVKLSILYDRNGTYEDVTRLQPELNDDCPANELWKRFPSAILASATADLRSEKPPTWTIRSASRPMSS